MPNRHILSFSATLLTQLVLMVSCKAALGQEGILNSKPAFNALVLEAMAARGSVLAGEFEYEVKYFVKDGDEFEWVKKGTFVFDDRIDSIAHNFTILYSKDAMNPNPLGVAPGSGISVSKKEGIEYRGGAVYSPGNVIAFRPEVLAGRPAPVDSPTQSGIIVPFDYRAFGFAFYGDMERRTPFDKVLGNYLIMDDKDVPELSGEKKLPDSFRPLKDDARYFQFGPTYLCVEPDKDYWVTQQLKEGPAYQTQPDGSRKVVTQLRSKCTLYLDKVDGFWLPKRALYRVQDRRLAFSIKWKSVNPDAGSLDFSAKSLSRVLEKPLVNIP